MSASRRTARLAILLGLVALVLAFVPALGVLLGACAVFLAKKARREGESGTGSLVLAVFALVLGLGFTGAYVACTPAEDVPGKQPLWEAFDRAFEPPPGVQAPVDAGVSSPDGAPGP